MDPRESGKQYFFPDPDKIQESWLLLHDCVPILRHHGSSACRLEADGYHTELVSGITSFCAAAARLNISLSEWNEQLHIIPAVHRLDNELAESGNYILMKSGKKMNQVKEILARSGKDVLMVENCGMPDEHIYHSVEEIPDDAGYYSLIIAKEHK